MQRPAGQATIAVTAARNNRAAEILASFPALTSSITGGLLVSFELESLQLVEPGSPRLLRSGYPRSNCQLPRRHGFRVEPGCSHGLPRRLRLLSHRVHHPASPARALGPDARDHPPCSDIPQALAALAESIRPPVGYVQELPVHVSTLPAPPPAAARPAA